MNPRRQIRRLATYQVAVAAIGASIAGAVEGFASAASFALGAGLTLFGVLILAWAVWRVLEQKSIAWTATLIISKYALLLSSIFFLPRADWFRPTAAGLGIASFIIPALLTAVFDRERELSRDTNSL